jgi:2-C-methyl-D-erythritol 4-phosphate cytidylyltransferase
MKEKKVSVILLAGGKGSRFGSSCPKQFISFKDKPIFQHSLELFSSIDSIFEIIVVMEEAYRELVHLPCKFALPGKERQDSVFNGLMQVDNKAQYVLIHDSARPLIKKEDVLKVIDEAFCYGAATLAVPLKFTVKSSLKDLMVDKTLLRHTLYEVQTPQVVKKELLIQGFEKVQKENLLVTDDVSIVEELNHPVKLTLGSYSNIKITTLEDLKQAHYLTDEKL